MKQFDFVVQASVGIHARPAMQLVNMTKKFQSDIKLYYKCFDVTCESGCRSGIFN